MRPTCPFAPALIALLLAGCGQFKEAPLVSKSQFPKAAVGIEQRVELIIEAFDAGEPKQADVHIHSMGKLFTTLETLARPFGLSPVQQAALEKATDELLDGLGELHGPMHHEVFPEDFDFEPVRIKLQKGLRDLRAALPEGTVEAMDEAAATREANRAELATVRPGPTADEATAEW